ncbi:MAG: hypothetical protein ACI81W_004266, partial [Saprospiraceae bacterium]
PLFRKSLFINGKSNESLQHYSKIFVFIGKTLLNL